MTSASGPASSTTAVKEEYRRGNRVAPIYTTTYLSSLHNNNCVLAHNRLRDILALLSADIKVTTGMLTLLTYHGEGNSPEISDISQAQTTFLCCSDIV